MNSLRWRSQVRWFRCTVYSFKINKASCFIVDKSDHWRSYVDKLNSFENLHIKDKTTYRHEGQITRRESRKLFLGWIINWILQESYCFSRNLVHFSDKWFAPRYWWRNIIRRIMRWWNQFAHFGILRSGA